MMNKKDCVNKFYSSLINVLNKKKKTIVLHEPTLDKLDKLYVTKCLDSKMISTAGYFR